MVLRLMLRLEINVNIVMFIVFNYQRPVGSRIPLVKPLFFFLYIVMFIVFCWKVGKAKN
jgi:hypothetical protein